MCLYWTFNCLCHRLLDIITGDDVDSFIELACTFDQMYDVQYFDGYSVLHMAVQLGGSGFCCVGHILIRTHWRAILLREKCCGNPPGATSPTSCQCFEYARRTTILIQFTFPQLSSWTTLLVALRFTSFFQVPKLNLSFVGAEDITEYLLLSNSVDIDQQSCDYDATRPLWLAIKENHLNMTEMLLLHGASEYALNVYGDTAVYAAVYYERLVILKMLVQHGCNCNYQSEYTICDTSLACCLQKQKDVSKQKIPFQTQRCISALANCSSFCWHRRWQARF